MRKPIIIGVGGPVGTGKTRLVEKLCNDFRDQYSLGAVTNDIFTLEDAKYLSKSGALEVTRIKGVETGGCPHTAIREDVSMNQNAIDELIEDHPDLDLVFVESGGDNLAATFSPDLVDAHIYVIDVSSGEEIPRKGGPGVTKADLLIINKTDLAESVGADLNVMETDAKMQRKERPTIFTNLKTKSGLQEVKDWVQSEVLFE